MDGLLFESQNMNSTNNNKNSKIDIKKRRQSSKYEVLFRLSKTVSSRKEIT